ncbi:ribokinase [Profundibacter amoris]|uniref:Ribokinase n=1 Tax=Profundibacter amoris TaxID=2171755 RepID=A0A347UL04_9RHOB|nr:ribokinase [Profundibacter amoris]AXX99532.1 ribokinase [Profundibacter amoris]
MTIYNLGSINADHFYQVPHLPEPGETLAANAFSTGLGGKGINQSVAAALAGSKVVHIGAVGPDGQWAVDRIAAFGVETQHIRRVETPTGHAIINVDANGENAIVIFSGANNCQSVAQIEQVLGGAGKGDILLLQNETTLQVEAAKIAHDRGLKVIYSAAPFSVDAVRDVMEYVTILMMNQVESEQLCAGLETDLTSLPVSEIIVTKGSNGAMWLQPGTGETSYTPSFPVIPVDTTAAGDTFAGYVAAGLDQGMNVQDAMRLASAAAALKVTRKGTADVIPSADEVANFLNANG